MRLFESGQTASAIDALDEGLRKEPGNSWLLNRKALLQLRLGQQAEASKTLAEVLKGDPKHLGALVLTTRLVLESEGAAAGAAKLQDALKTYAPEKRGDLASLVKVVGAFLSEAGDFPAALRHLRLAQSLVGTEADTSIASTLRMIEGNPSISPWLKNPDTLSPAPENLKGEALKLFNEALDFAAHGIWSEAAAIFSTLSTDPVAGPLANRNHGFTRLWLANDAAAATALRRYAATLGPTDEAVDLEALCQEIVPPGSADLVEQVQLTWPIRNRELLLKALESDPTISSQGIGPLNDEDPDSPQGHRFALLDRRALTDNRADLKAADIPVVLGHLLIGPETVALECYDDGRLDALSDRFTTTAGPGIPPAHPKTKILGKAPIIQVALMWEWILPRDVDAAISQRLHAEQGRRVIETVWPNVKMSSLHGRTPRQAAKAGDSAVPLRAAVCQLEQSRESWQRDFDFKAFRESLGIELEPILDSATVDVSSLHLARLSHVNVDGLSDANLVALYRRSRASVMTDPLERAANALTERGNILKTLGIDPLSVYSDLAMIATSRGQRDKAFELLKQGRESEEAVKRGRNAPIWDMLEVRVGAQIDDPTVWVAELAVVLERYHQDAEASQLLTMSLVDMGLIQVVQNPERPGEVMLDSRRLQYLLTEYGPRVTTASGKLGVSATKPAIWTPGGAAASSPSKGIWTPGSKPPAPTTTSQPPSTGPSKLIVPGR